jgi:hypothetical protein
MKPGRTSKSDRMYPRCTPGSCAWITGATLSIRPLAADTLCGVMTEKEPQVLAAPTDVDEATDTPTAIDEDELEKARLDERWREFCLNAEQHVAETTRPKPRVEQPA